MNVKQPSRRGLTGWFVCVALVFGTAFGNAAAFHADANWHDRAAQDADKKVEKKDRLVNEPVQFMVTKVRQPYSLEVNELYEIVVNEVGKDRIKGYLAAPRSTSPAL